MMKILQAQKIVRGFAGVVEGGYKRPRSYIIGLKL